MDHLDHPALEIWEARRRWVESLAEPPHEWSGYLASEQASALAADVQSAFCAGAWVAVIVLAAAVIDAQLREDDAPGFRGSTNQLIEVVGGDERYHALRKRRNSLVHVSPDSPAITVEQQWSDRQTLEQDARAAIRSDV